MRPFSLLLLLLPLGLHAQGVNAYARITGIAGAVLTVGTSSESVTSFAIGKDVVIMQMQDDVIGANTANNSSFGNLSSIQQAGRYEVRSIVSVTRSMGVLTSITLDAAPAITFNTGANASVQAITFELLGAGGNHTLGSAITAPAWNGSIGGVVAIQVGGILTIGANISADARGFRGGARDRFSYTSPCNTTDFIWSSVAAGTEYFATKGEGIYRNTNNAIADGRGKMINAGGGANQINAGGGGGGNYTAGGSALLGWSCTADAGGIGGIALSGHISASRVFMGGGGGGGEGNDDVSTDGANGGGIVLIKAAQLVTTGTCAGVRISANGGTAANSGNDGPGGGGGGGTVVFQVPSFSFSATCSLVIAANGGNGGSVNSSTHGGGGGGGQGAVIFSSATPTGNVTIQSMNGTGGCDNSSCTSRANGGSGTNNTGVVINSSGPLPIELISFQAIPVGDRVDLRWTTASEENNASFTVERSIDQQDWQNVAFLPGAGTSQTLLNYTTVDPRPLPNTSYYRLRQTDLDGTMTWSDAVPVHFTGQPGSLAVFPNPAEERITVVHLGSSASGSIRITDTVGRTVQRTASDPSGSTRMDVASLAPGSYVVVFETADTLYSERLIVDR
ncbi:MAG: T9SS type A sorting domain-containing protein [Flavobacteriales bacterium]|nr:T9SS type A sorting domain-containing protein [Flavobacteriales bacterium]